MNENKLAYRLRILKESSFKRMTDIVKEVSKRTGKSKLACLLDMIHCIRKFGCGYHDYIIFHFYDLTEEERATYMTRLKNKKFVQTMNDENYEHLFNNKNEFDELFKDYIKREYVDMVSASKEEVIEYFSSRDKVFAKMLDLLGGEGAEIVNKADFANEDELYDYIKGKNFGVLEDLVVNHPDINDIYPHAVNTLRMVTLVDDEGKSHLLYVAQKFGNDGKFVDIHGMHAPVNLETGEIDFPFHSGRTTTDIFYTEHPYTGKNLMDYKVPFFEEAKKMILEAALVVPQMRYVGWDVAITPNGPLIIEGNNYGAYEYMQLPKQSAVKTGILPRIQKILPNYKF